MQQRNDRPFRGRSPRTQGSATRRTYNSSNTFRPGRRHGSNGRQSEVHHSRFVNKAASVAPDAPFVPSFRFSDLTLDPSLKRSIAAQGYDAPTPIQDAVIPHILRGKDVVGIANTGTGKTLAFLVPLIQRMINERHAQALIVTPTRELALQIHEALAALTRGMRFYSTVAVGGVNIRPQIRALKERQDVVVGTPGRLKDLIQQRALDLSSTNVVVLDEADRMLDMGFIHDMRFLMERMRQDRQTLFFSATMSKEIERVVGDFLRDPEYVSVKTRDTSKNVDQDVRHIAPHEEKLDVLHSLLSEPEYEKVIVFGRTKWGVEKLAKQLVHRGVAAESIHGNKDHSKRVRALDAFKSGRVRVLVATDVAARGLDIPAVSHVINYDAPSTYEDYVHRIGRTGRADKTGKALTFIGAGSLPSHERTERPEYSRR